MFLLERKAITSSFLPDRSTSSKDSSLLIVHTFLATIEDTFGAFAMIPEPLDALLG